MTRYDTLMQRLGDGERVLIDGATGTEIERRGVPRLENAWNGGGALTHPDILRQVHEDYIGQGAKIIISNTFATCRHSLRDAGAEDRFEELNRRGVELALEARARAQRPEVLVAGGISYWSWTGNHPHLDTLRGSIEDQAAIMAGAGADLLMLEMMVDIDRMLVTLEAAETSGLPIWAGLTCQPDAAGTVTLRNGEPLTEALAALEDRKVPLVSIMHTEVEHIDACLEVLRDHWPGLVGVYAHSGTTVDGKWTFDDTISPESYRAYAKGWLEQGVLVIGGCCGIRVDHIEAVQEVL